MNSINRLEFSQYDPWTKCISIIWELVRNVNYWSAHAKPPFPQPSQTFHLQILMDAEVWGYCLGLWRHCDGAYHFSHLFISTLSFKHCKIKWNTWKHFSSPINFSCLCCDVFCINNFQLSEGWFVWQVYYSCVHGVQHICWPFLLVECCWMQKTKSFTLLYLSSACFYPTRHRVLFCFVFKEKQSQ